MATIFFDGFDTYATADLLKRWTGMGASLGVGPLYSRSPSGQGLQASANASALAGTCLYKSFGVNYTQGVVGIAYRESGALTNRTILVVADGISEQISVRTNASSVLVVNRGGTLLATGTTVLSANTWYFVELKFSIHASAGTVLLQLNGVAETLTYVTGTSTTQNTKATANVQWNGFGPGSSSTTCNFDDVYVLDTSTGTNTTFLGPIRCAVCAPAAPGNYAQWTPNGGTNAGNVSEPYEDGDTSFNQSSTANQIDSFVMQDLPVSSGSVYSLQTLTTARQDAGAARTMAGLLRISGADYPGATASLSSSYQILADIHDLQPVGGTPAWDPATVAAMEAGYKLIS